LFRWGYGRESSSNAKRARNALGKSESSIPEWRKSEMQAIRRVVTGHGSDGKSKVVTRETEVVAALQ